MTSSHAAYQVPTPDGREIETLVIGPEDGFPLVFHHGTPSGAVPFGILERPALARKLRVIACSRPGYGRSTPRADVGRATVADDALDTATVLDCLGLREFVTLGWSGGGPRALACAAVLPDRCLAAASAVGIAPPDAEGLDLLEGMGPENIAEYSAVRAGREALEEFLVGFSPAFFNATAEDVVAAFGELLPEVDKAAMTGEFAEYVALASRHAGAQGIAGWRDDDLTHTRPWGFDLGSVTVPVSVWQGTEDRMVPFAHAVWLSENVAGARPQLEQGEGHVSLLMQIDRILDDLLEQAGL